MLNAIKKMLGYGDDRFVGRVVFTTPAGNTYLKRGYMTSSGVLHSDLYGDTIVFENSEMSGYVKLGLLQYEYKWLDKPTA